MESTFVIEKDCYKNKTANGVYKENLKTDLKYNGTSIHR